MNAKLNKHQLDALEQQGHLGNTALADALRKVVDAKQVVLKSSVAPTPPTLTVVPTPESTVQKSVNIIPDAVNIPATSVQTPVSSVPTPSVTRMHKWNITIWTIIDDRESTKLVKHVANLLRKNEIPIFAISLREDGGKTSLTLKGELVSENTDVKFKVIEGSGRLLETFPKNTVFFGSELSGYMVPSVGRQEIVTKFKMEVNALLHQLDIALRSKVKNLKS